MCDMSRDDAAAVRLILVQRRDTVAPRDPLAAKIRRYRLARVQLEGRAEVSQQMRRVRPT